MFEIRDPINKFSVERELFSRLKEYRVGEQESPHGGKNKKMASENASQQDEDEDNEYDQERKDLKEVISLKRSS